VIVDCGMGDDAGLDALIVLIVDLPSLLRAFFFSNDFT